MYSKVGTPENCKEMEKEWNQRLAEIDDKLKAFQDSHIHHPGSTDTPVSLSDGLFVHIFG